MSYSKLFSVINCQCIVFFEDDFTQNAYQKETAFYDMIRMELKDRNLFTEQVSTVSGELAEQLRSFFLEFDKFFNMIDWENDVIARDISGALDKIKQIDQSQGEKIEKLFSDIDDGKVKEVYELGIKYGIGMNYPGQLEDLFENYICEDKHCKSIRIYNKDYSAEIAEEFRNDINQASGEESIVCIIDDQLEGNKRAKEIIDTIRTENKGKRKNVIGSIFSSQATDDMIDDKVYFELVRKEDANKLEASIIKSAYNYFIDKLKDHTMDKLNKAFEIALRNKGIAFFLSKKGQIEGESEYQIIKDWIQLLSTDTSSEDEIKVIKHLISLSRIINSLEDTQGDSVEFLHQYNTYEAFDYSVNKYYLPVAPGDIFTDDNGKWYVLIGQDCDIARSVTRKPKNALAELLPATLHTQSKFDKCLSDLKTASIYNFRRSIEEESEILQVEYSKREFIDNEIINLCAYNPDGQCCLHLTNRLPDDVQALIPEYMINYYEDLQGFFSSIKTIKEKAQEAFALINDKKYVQRLISVEGYSIDEDILKFKLRRVCRLTHTYVFYLYKLYLEYRGRQPFQGINLVRQEDTILPIKYDGQIKEVKARFVRIPHPENDNPSKYKWFIEQDEINRILKELGIEESVIGKKKETDEGKEYFLVENKTTLMIKQTVNYLCFEFNGGIRKKR